MTISASLIKNYCAFMQKETYEFPLYPRDWRFIHTHLMTTYNYMNTLVTCKIKDQDMVKEIRVPLNLKILKSTKMLKQNLRNSISNINQCSEMSTYGQNMDFSSFPNYDNMSQVDIFQQLYLFLHSYAYAYGKLDKLIPNALNEYHNVMAYMMPIFYKENTEYDYPRLIRSIQSHINVGSLHSCKSVIALKKSFILDDEKLLGLFYRLKSLESGSSYALNIHNNKQDVVIKYIKYMKRVGELH